MDNKKTKIEFLNNALLIDNSILVFSDFHLGYEDYLIREGMLPNIQFRETMKAIDEIFRELFLRIRIVKKIVILGDLKHDFGKVNEAEWRESIKLLDYFIKKVGEKNIILIKGNHDNYLIGVAKKRGIKLEKYWKYKGISFMHGNELYKKAVKDAKILILGHLHPAITLSDEYKKEKYKCFLKGKWKKKTVYILPSFTNLSQGYDVSGLEYSYSRNKDRFSFIGEKELKNFEIIIYNPKEKKAYNFGKVRKLKSD
jgi:putative SbcD/Mre11-related phosphoesterase